MFFFLSEVSWINSSPYEDCTGKRVTRKSKMSQKIIAPDNKKVQALASYKLTKEAKEPGGGDTHL